MNRALRSLALVLPALLACLVSAWSAAQGPAAPLDDAERRWLAAHPVIRVGVAAADWSPIDVVGADGRYTGISADYLELLAQRAGFRWEATRRADFPAVLQAARAGEIDLIPSTARTPERDAYLRFSVPYLAVTPVFVTRRDDTAFSPQRDLSGLRLAQPRGFATVEALRRRYPGATIVELPDTLAALRAVSSGAADVYVGALPPTVYAVEKNLLANLAIRGEAQTGTGELRFAVPQQGAVLAGIVDKALATVTEEEHRAIRGRWAPVTSFLGDASRRLELTAAERAWLAAHPRIRVGFDRDFAPFSSAGANGEPVGLAADYLALLGQRLGIHFEPAAGTAFGGLLEALEQGQVDLALAMVHTAERARRFQFAGPYLATPTAIVTRLDDPVVVEPGDLAGRRVAILRHHYLIDLLRRKHPSIQLVEVDNAEQGAALLVRHDVDAMINNLINVSPLINGAYLGRLKLAATVGEAPAELSFALRGDWPQLAALLARALDSVTPEEHRAIRQKWLTVEYRHGIPWHDILLVALPLVLAALVVLWLQGRANRRLRAEVQRRRVLEAELRSARDAAEGAARAKAAFMSSMSHEIRTPMNGVLGVVEVLSRSPLSASQRFSVRVIRDSARALLQLLNDVLDFSRIEAERLSLDIQPADLREVVEQAAVLFAAQAQRKGLHFELRAAPELAQVLCFDAGRLRQILANLLSNAIKFCDHGTVRIDVQASDEGNRQRVVILVTDTGIGIDAARQATLFQPYAQADAGIARRFGGTGLGLVISRRLAELMGGTLTLTSEPARGTQVALTLQVDVAQRVRPVAALARGRRVLVLDDGHWDAQGATVILRHCGAEAMRMGMDEPVPAADLVIGTTHALHALARRPDGLLDAVRVEVRLNEVMEIEVVSPRHYVVAGVPLLPSALEQALRLAGDASGREIERYLKSAVEPEARRSDRLVLVVDDHPVNLLVLREQLSVLGVEAELYESAEAALAAWQPGRFALVITDLNMGDLDGYAFARQLREREAQAEAPRVPVVALTGEVAPELAERVTAAGMDAVLQKPLDIAALSACLDQWMPVSQASRESLDRALLESLYGSPERTGRVLQGFLAAMARDVPDLHAAIDMRDVSWLAQVLHRIRAAAQSVKLDSLGRQIEALKAAAAQGSWDEARKMAQAFADLAERLRAVHAAEFAS